MFMPKSKYFPTRSEVEFYLKDHTHDDMVGLIFNLCLTCGENNNQAYNRIQHLREAVEWVVAQSKK